MGFSQYLLDTREQYRLQVRLRNGWIIRLRWVYLTGLSAVAFASSYTTEETSPYRSFIIGLLIGGLTLNTILWLFNRFQNLHIRTYHIIAFLQILLDASLAASVVYFQGGVDSRATVLFAIPILICGVLYMPLFAYISALVCASFYIIALAAYAYNDPITHHIRDAFLPAIFYTFVFLLLATIVSGYTKRNNAKEREDSYAELLSLLRHQLHHPSGVIAAIVDMLEHGDGFNKLSARDKAYVRQLKHENHRIHTMISNLLQVADVQQDLDKSMTNKWGDVDIMTVLSNCATNIAVTYKRVDDLVLEIPNEHIIIHGLEEKLQLAFENIIDNAFKYSDAGHKVVVNLISKKAPTVEIDIIDHGEGIDTKAQHKLFKAFSNIDEASKDGEEAIRSYSMGLGLYISKVIIEQHGGKLELQSKPGEGTKVIVQLRRDMWRYLYGQK